MIKVLIYTCSENSPRNDKFIFSITNADEEKRKQDKINTAITTERERLNTERLKEALDDKTKQLDEAEEYIGELQEELEALRQKKYNPREVNFGNIDSQDQSQLYKKISWTLDVLTDLKYVYNECGVPAKQELIRQGFDSNLYYQEGVYRTPSMMEVFHHNLLKMSEKGLLFFDGLKKNRTNSPVRWR